MIRLFTFLAISTFIFWGCTPDQNIQSDVVISNPEYGSLQDLENPPFEFDLIDSVLVYGPNNQLFGELSALTTDQDGNMYVYDDQLHKLISFSADGTFRWITGQQGRGPGDFDSLNDLVANNEWLVAGNQNGTRIDLYDFGGHYLQSKNMPENVEFKYFRYANYQGFSSNGNLIINTIHWDGWGHNVYALDLNGDSTKVVNHFLIDQSGGLQIPEMMNVSAPITLHEDQVIGGSLQDYTLEVYDLKGNLEKEIQRDFTKIIRPGMYNEQGRRSMDFYAMVESPYVLPEGFWMVPAYWATNVSDPDERLEQDLKDVEIPEVTYRNSIDFFNSEGELLYSLEAEGEHPEIGEISHVDKRGVVYIIKDNPEPMIYRYRVLTPES